MLRWVLRSKGLVHAVCWCARGVSVVAGMATAACAMQVFTLE